MPILDPVPGDVPSTPTNAPPSAEQGAEQPTSPGIRTATAYAERYEAPYRLSDQMEGLAGLMLFGGLTRRRRRRRQCYQVPRIWSRTPPALRRPSMSKVSGSAARGTTSQRR